MKLTSEPGARVACWVDELVEEASPQLLGVMHDIEYPWTPRLAAAINRALQEIRHAC